MFFLMLCVFLVGIIMDIDARESSYESREMSKKERFGWSWSIILLGISGMALTLVVTSNAYEENVVLSSGALTTTNSVIVYDDAFSLNSDGTFALADTSHGSEDVEITNVVIADDETPHYEVTGDISHRDWLYGVGGESEIVKQYVFYVHE